VEDLGEIVGEFLLESHENLDQIDRDLVHLEQDPDSRDLISRIFRAIHTIKGTSGFLAFSRLETLAHAGESLLSKLRDGVQPVTPATHTLIIWVPLRKRHQATARAAPTRNRSGLGRLPACGEVQAGGDGLDRAVQAFDERFPAALPVVADPVAARDTPGGGGEFG